MAGILAFARFLPLIISGLAVAALPLLWNARTDYLERIERLERQLVIKEAALYQEREAKAVLNAHLKRMEKSNARTTEDLLFLQSLPGRDAPLSDLLRATVNRLR